VNTSPRHHGSTTVAAVLLAAAIGLVADGGVPARAAPGDFTVAPTTLSFPATYIGATTEIAVAVTNVSSTSQSPGFAGGAPSDGTNFGSVQNCAGKTFAPGESCTFTYRFHPKSEGSLSTNTAIGIDGENFAISMSGSGLFPLSVAPTSLSFPDTAVGATSTLEVVVTNISPASQTPSFAGGAPSDSANFGSVQNCAGKTFSPGATCTFTYTFKPAAPGMLSTATAIGADGKNFAISMSGNAIDLSTTTTTTTTSTTTTTDTSPTTTTPASPTTAASAEPTSPTATSTAIGTAPALPFSPGPGPIVSGQAAVIAQGIVEFPAGLLQWEHQQLDPGSWPYAFDGSPPAFFVADGPDAVLVSGDDGPLGLLDAGEATFVQSGLSGSVAPTFDGAVAAARRITFVSGAGPESFTPGEGRRDVNLIQGFVAPGESVSVTSPFPVLVVTDGELVDATGSVVGVSSGAVTLGMVVELRNDGSEPAIVLAAAVGRQIP
jgi:hypothetical protein